MANLKINGNLTVTGGGVLGGNDIVTTTNKQTKGIKLSNGLIINWGAISPDRNSTTINFAIPFSDNTYAVGATNDSITSNQIRAMASSYKTATSFMPVGQYSQANSGWTTGDVEFTWVAIGY